MRTQIRCPEQRRQNEDGHEILLWTQQQWRVLQV